MGSPFVFVVVLGFALSSCASFRRNTDSTPVVENVAPAPIQPDVQPQVNVEDLQLQIATLQDRVRILEAENATLQKAKPEKKPEHLPEPVSMAGGRLPPPTDGGMDQSEPVQRFKKARILQESQKNSDALLEYSAFLRDFADHPLAPYAQFALGEIYLSQKEYRLAIEEYQRVALSYDGSSYVPDALARMVICQENLKLLDEATKNKQLLFSLFPQSTAALDLERWLRENNVPKNSPGEPVVAPAETAPVPESM